MPHWLRRTGALQRLMPLAGIRVKLAAAAAVVAAFGAATPARASFAAQPVAGAAGLHTGCDRARPAIAYRVGRRALRRRPPGAPIPCLIVIGQRTSESADVDVLRTGQILYAPLVENSYPPPLDDRGPAEIATSSDRGAHWETLVPGDTNHILDVPPWMSVDPHTQRIWFATVLPDLCGAEISWSDTAGRSWRTNPAVGCPAMGSESVLEGPAPSGRPQPSGYPHAVYYCANASDLSPSTLWCYRSLDGGTSFTFTGSFPDPPPQPNCSTEHPARPGAVGTDGYLYFPVFQCGALSMAISRDEGNSWQRVRIGTYKVNDMYTTSVAVDPAGNVYLAWIEGLTASSHNGSGASSGPNPVTEAINGSGVPMLSISRDHGATWSKPVAVGPPGVRDAQMIAITAQRTGQIAISYLANTSGSTLVDGWLSETANALVPHALWWAAPLNDPRTPLIDTSDSTTFGNRLFFDTDNFGPDGQPWAAFHCAFTAACPNERIPVIGRLAPPPRQPHKRHRHRGKHRHHHREGRER